MKRTGAIQFWPAAVVSLLGLNVAVVGVTVYYATHDKSAAVEADYYKKAVEWDSTARKQLDQNRLLGWKLECEPTGGASAVVKVTDRDGKALAGLKIAAECWHNALPSERRSVTFDDVGGGKYRVELGSVQSGYWHFEIAAQQGSEKATAKTDVFVTSSGK